MALKLELLPDQKDALKFCLESPYSILALEMGMGKSGVGLAIFDRLKSPFLLIVCPAGLIDNWIDEINKFLFTEKITITVFRSNAEVHFPFDSHIVIASYDIAKNHKILFDWANAVILDEATEVKSMEAKRSESIHQYIYESQVPRVHLLTGTPIKNRVRELYSLISICNYNPRLPDVSDFLKKFPNEIAFAEYFSNRKEFDKFNPDTGRVVHVIQWEGIKEKNYNELKSLLKGIYFHRKSKMPPVEEIDVWVKDSDHSISDRLLLDLENFVDEKSGVTSGVKAQAALQMAPITCEYVKSLKSTKNAPDGLPRGPLIVFTDHKESCELIAKELGTKALHGEVSVKVRHEYARAFQRGELPFLVATTGCFKAGYTLTKGNEIILNDPPWVTGDLSQLKYRINRYSQTRKCYIHFMLGTSQAEYIFKVLGKKQIVIDRVTN